MTAVTPDELFNLRGRVAVLTGATGRLGRITAAALAGAGATTWLVARDADRLDALTKELTDQGLDVRSARGDVTSDDDMAALGATLREAHGRVDVLVHNAHVGRSGSLRSSRAADYMEATDLALVAFQRLLDATRELLVAAARDGSPSVITMASQYGLISPKPHLYDSPEKGNPPFYGAVKAGLIQLTRYAAVELAPDGIRVNSLTLGSFPGDGDPGLLGRLAEESPLKRNGDASEIATSVLYLASPRTSYVTGANIVVDGGRTIW
ncbi:SDR family oxidoreductase [Actinoplanes sp. TBRC 11911]|uniref:SDR family NAD(P)-dependent oxidoreductase n=1 Tax=Actinoplanes sp. TBRC 11911 TaxID=2729386 RepID=UPI00145CD757|nr:SDR family oxidoreductase [Actinoplanes sp. TBRC 11911]NMO55027.1 SDR family oxidoreductase [Actinoplanes sp. TBRC 11911]